MTIARFSSVYPLLGTSRIDGDAVPRSWKNVAMLGGMRGALSVALVASWPAKIPRGTVITSMVLGVAFLSIVVEGPLLSRYIRKQLPRRIEIRELSKKF